MVSRAYSFGTGFPQNNVAINGNLGKKVGLQIYNYWGSENSIVAFLQVYDMRKETDLTYL